MEYREEWLNKAVRMLEQVVFKPRGHSMPEKWAVTCGWAIGAGRKQLGCCMDPSQSEDNTTQLFIAPVDATAERVISTLVHEMIHAIVTVKEGHKGKFRELCKTLEMSKPYRCAGLVKGTKAWEEAQGVAASLGPYPHTPVKPKQKPSRPQQWTRWRSKTNQKYTVLANTKTIIEWGVPRDPQGKEMEPCDPSKIFGWPQDGDA